MRGTGIKFYSQEVGGECAGYVHNTQGPDWLFVEDIGGDLRWIRRDMVTVNTDDVSLSEGL